jgi:hypothetical protein
MRNNLQICGTCKFPIDTTENNVMTCGNKESPMYDDSEYYVAKPIGPGYKCDYWADIDG